MREIEFSAKRISDGKWVYGVPLKVYDEDEYIMTDGNDVCGYSQYVNHERVSFAIEETALSHIDPETIGQYTGIKDKTIIPYKKIYENNIVKFHRIRYGDIGNEINIDGVGKVEYNEFQARYIISPIGNTGYEQSLCTDWKGGESTEIIGNTFDNPELLKEA